MDAILIVDDEPQLRNLVRTILENAGYLCRTAENAAAAKEVMEQMQFDLLLTDLNMPGESGIDLIRYMKERYPLTAAIMVTVIDDPGQAQEVLALGVYGYILKPFTRNMLLINVENALRRHRLELKEQQHTRLLEREVAARTRLLDEQLFFLQTLMDAIPVPVYYKNTHLVYLGCNRAFEKVMNKKRDFIVGKTTADLYPPKLAEAFVRKDKELLQTPGMQKYERESILPDTSVRSEITHKASFLNSKGEVAGLIGVRLDITELKRSEQSLRVSEEKLRTIMDNLHIGVAMISPQMELLQVNRQMQQWFPDTATETGKCCYEILSGQHQQGPCDDCPAKLVFGHGKSHESTITHHTMNGDRILRVFASPIFDEAGTLTAVIEILEDVTEKLAKEREFRQAQKLEAIGQLAAGIAHEINTPMQYLGDNIHFLEDAFTDLLGVYNEHARLLQAVKSSEPVAEVLAKLEESIAQADPGYLFEEIPTTLQQSLEGINRVGAIVCAMREFSHPGTEEKSHVDINRTLENAITISRNEWKYVAEIETDLTPDLPLLLCLPGEINQVLLNVIVNASHAIDDVTDGGNKGKGRIRLTTSVRDGWMEILIADTGGGIPEAVQHRIFDPFFTTKKVGKGTGQGLAIARSAVVDKHQGTIRFETVAGKGTTFIIQLPLQ